MPYKITIRSELGKPIPGLLYLWSEGGKIGEFDIPIGGTTLTDDQVALADHFTVESPGYHFYGTSELYNDTVFTLQAKQQIGLYVAVALVGGFALSRLIKFKL